LTSAREREMDLARSPYYVGRINLVGGYYSRLAVAEMQT
jgi:hypothetical protein